MNTASCSFGPSNILLICPHRLVLYHAVPLYFDSLSIFLFWLCTGVRLLGTFFCVAGARRSRRSRRTEVIPTCQKPDPEEGTVAMMFQKWFKTFIDILHILVHTRKLPTLDMGHIQVQFPQIPLTLSSTIPGPSSLISLNSNQIEHIATSPYIVQYISFALCKRLSRAKRVEMCRITQNE